MVNITDKHIQNTLPNSISRDEKVQNISAVVEKLLHEINKETGYVLLLPRLDELSEQLIDELAWQFHVDFYDNNAAIEVKRDLVRNAIKWHRRKGTPYAVEAICQAAFKYCDLKEWFDYEGEPYHFRIENIGSNMPDKTFIDVLMDAIYKTKNVRSWCDGLEFQRNLVKVLYMMVTANCEKEVVIRQIVSLIKEDRITLHCGAGMVIYRKVEMS